MRGGHRTNAASTRLAVVLATAAFACGPGPLDGGPGGGKPSAPVLGAPEVFTFGDQPIAFAPPPEGWERQREQSGGLRGARFVKTGSVGERIHVAEHYAVGDRDRCVELGALLRDLDELDERAFRNRLQRAAPWIPKPITIEEPLFAQDANAQLDAARDAFRKGDMAAVRREIAAAIVTLGQIHYRLEDVVDRVMFQASSLDEFGTVVVATPVASERGGVPSIEVDFTLDSRERARRYHGREVYLAYNNRLFVASFLGLEENLPLFDAVVASISFPEGPCSH